MILDWYGLQSALLWVWPFILIPAVIVIGGSLLSMSISLYKMYLMADNKRQYFPPKELMNEEEQNMMQYNRIPRLTSGKKKVAEERKETAPIAVELGLDNLVSIVSQNTGYNHEDSLRLIEAMARRTIDNKRGEKLLQEINNRTLQPKPQKVIETSPRKSEKKSKHSDEKEEPFGWVEDENTSDAGQDEEVVQPQTKKSDDAVASLTNVRKKNFGNYS